MKIGIDNYSYHRFFGEVYPGQPAPGEQWHLSDFVDHILSLNYLTRIEDLSIETCFIDEDDKVVQELKRLEIPLSFGWGHPNGFMDVDIETVKREIEKYLQLSQLFDASLMRIVGSSIKYFSEPHPPQIEKTKKYLEQILPLAEQYDVKLAIENHGDFYMHELAEILEHFSSPYLGLTCDTGNFLRFNEDPIDAIESFRERILVVHAKDVALMEGYDEEDPRRLGCVPAGEGTADFPGIFRALKNLQYTGPILIEVSRMHPLHEAHGEHVMIEKSIEFLHQVRASLEQ